MRLASDPLPTLSIYKQRISVYAISDKKMKKGERNLSRQRERETFEPQMNTSFILSITNSSADIRLSSTGNRLTSASCFAHMVQAISAH